MLGRGEVVAPAKSLAQMQQIIFNDYVNAGLTALFMFVVVSMLIFSIRACLQALRHDRPTARETAFEALPGPSVSIGPVGRGM